MEIAEALARLRADLHSHVDAAYRDGASRFFKEPITLYGVRVPIVRAIAGEHWRRLSRDWGYADFVKLSGKLMRTGFFEEPILAFSFLAHYRKRFDGKTLKLFDGWLEEHVSNWAHCDILCTQLISPIIEKEPRVAKALLAWTRSTGRWKRRAAAVSLVPAARIGNLLPTVFKVARRLLRDEDEMVQKGVGWLLKEASRRREGEVVKFLLAHKADCPRLVLRYAAEKMSKKGRKLVLS